jgi:broad specificity phosphatase PhoE
MSTIIGLLRHGQTDWNVDMRLQGVSDIPLNEFGREQANTAAEVLKSGTWEMIVSSPLSRALETANIVASKLGFENVDVLPELIERSFGVAEGLSYDDWKTRYQDGQNVDQAETIAQLDVRAIALLALLANNFEGQRVLTVSHGALIRRLIHIISNGEFPREGERFGNASLTTIEHDGDDWKILNYDPKPLS